MRNIPVFTTSNGVASLILKEIPYKEDAYVRLQDTQALEAFLKECSDFCRAAGAKRLFASGHEGLDAYPLHTEIWQMSCLRESLPETEAALFPVQQQTLEKWRQIYNEKMLAVPNASYMTVSEAQELLKKGSAYYVHHGNTLLGIGIAAGEAVGAVIAVRPGAGADVLLALNHALSGDRILVEVSSANAPAIRLYCRLGFTKTMEISRWYQIF